MQRFQTRTRLVALLVAAELLGPPTASADSSAAGTLVDLGFTGRLRTDSALNQTAVIADQVRYTIGQLNGYGGGTHPDGLAVSEVRSRPVGGQTEITYAAVLPAVWPSRGPLPRTAELVLPLDMSFSGQEAFANRYGRTCVDSGAHDVDSGTMPDFFRPRASGCQIAAADAHRVSATISLSKTRTTGRFPEYDRIWADRALHAVVIFGKFEAGATTATDAGIAAYNAFVAMLKARLGGSVTTVPASIPTSPGPGTPDIQFRSRLPDRREIDVAVLLVDSLHTALPTPSFRSRYDALSTRADLIVYNGPTSLLVHHMLGNAGRWVPGQYAIVFLNGPDSWSYLDRTFVNARRSLNPDDPSATRYLDLVANAMPAFFVSMPAATMAMFGSLASPDDPKTYEQILGAVGGSQLPVVMGEQDNAFRAMQAPPWGGLDETGTVARNEARQWSTPSLPPGRYAFTLTGTGDVDLYVRSGSAPTTTTYDCRPHTSGSNEACSIQLTQPRAIHVMVRGYATSSTFRVIGQRE
jgi:hypothetical protein